MRLFFIASSLFLFFTSSYTVFWSDLIARPYILHSRDGWHYSFNKLAIASLTASIVATIYFFKKFPTTNDFFLIGSGGLGALTGASLALIAKREDTVFIRGCDQRIYKPRQKVRNPDHRYAAALIIHNKDTLKSNNKSWQKISLLGLIQLESIASKCYQKRLETYQKNGPKIISWLLPPQKFEISGTITYKDDIYPLERPCKEGWLRAGLRALLYPPTPQRSLNLQKKIEQALLPITLLKKRMEKYYQNFEIEVGDFSVFPAEIWEIIMSYATPEKDVKIDISNEEFFVHLLPYIQLRIEENYIIRDGKIDNDIRLPQDDWDLINSYYGINWLFRCSEYSIDERTLMLDKKQCKKFMKKNKISISKKEFITDLVETLNMEPGKITVKDNSNFGDRPFFVV